MIKPVQFSLENKENQQSRPNNDDGYGVSDNFDDNAENRDNNDDDAQLSL